MDKQGINSLKFFKMTQSPRLGFPLTQLKSTLFTAVQNFTLIDPTASTKTRLAESVAKLITLENVFCKGQLSTTITNHGINATHEQAEREICEMAFYR